MYTLYCFTESLSIRMNQSLYVLVTWTSYNVLVSTRAKSRQSSNFVHLMPFVYVLYGKKFNWVQVGAWDQ